MNLFISADAFEAAVEASPAHKATLNHRRRKVAEYRLQQHNGHNGVGWGTAETVSCVPDVAVPCMGWLIVFLLTQCLLLKWRKRKGFYPKASRLYAARCYKVYMRRKCALDRKVIRLYVWYNIVLRYILDIKVFRAKVRCKKKLISLFDRCKLMCVNVTVSIYHHAPAPMRVSAAVIFLGLLISGNVELNPGPKQDVKPTLKELMKRLDGCVAQWRHIGVQLDFEKADLDDIKQINPTDNRGCLYELMGRWLDHGDASWSNLVDALENCRVNKKIIDSITSDYYDNDEYEKAIAAGSIEIQATKATFSGISGSGKSTLCALLMNKPPPSTHNSTPVAETAIQATVEYDSNLVCPDIETWEHVDQDKLRDMILHTLDNEPLVEESTPFQEYLKSDAGSTASNPKSVHTQFSENTKPKDSLRSKLRERIRDLTQFKRGKNVRSLKHLLYLVDVGGQVQFQEIVPLFVRNASVNVIVIKLSSKLADKPKNVYCIEGENKIAEPEHMVNSLEDFIVNTTDSVFSLKRTKLDIEGVKKAPDEPKVVLVGTFPDEEDTQENRKIKQDALRKNAVFGKHIKQNHVITFGKELILDINGSKKGYQKEDNKEKLKKLRAAILQGVSKLTVNVPISWFLLLLDIDSESDKHKFITLERCYELGKEWVIEETGVDSALCYFDELNLILYFPSTCPGTVFCNPQFLLRKVTDMIVASFPALTPEVDDMSGSREIFKRDGIFGRELFNTSEYHEGFNEQFNQDHLLELMQDRLIIAKVSSDSKQHNKDSREDEKFFMPCVLKMEEETPLSHIDQGSSPVEPLIITFTHESSPHGLFCATIVSLLQSAKEKPSKLKWVLGPSEKLVRKRNKVEFEMFDPPPTSSDDDNFSSKIGTITLEDNLKNFVVCIRGDTLVNKCFAIFKDLKQSLKKASENLCYKGFDFAVLCPRCKDKHPVKLLYYDYKWKCENEPYTGDTGPLSEKQLPWFKDCTKDKGIKRGRSESDGSGPHQEKHPKIQSEPVETAKDTIPSPIRVVKPGSIKEPDSLFNQLAKNIGDKYKQVGIDLGLTFMDLHNQLETGHTLMLPANEKALKMLMLWRDNSLEKDFTYVILATALENHGLTSFADKHCYMDHSGSQ